MGGWRHRHAVVLRASIIDLFPLVYGDFCRIVPRGARMDNMCRNALAQVLFGGWSDAHLFLARNTHRI